MRSSRAAPRPVRLDRRLAWAGAAALLVALARCSGAAEPLPADAHPLLPGVRDPRVNDPNWRRGLHDELATGFSPLSCGMRTAPQVAWAIPGVGQIRAVRTLRLPDGTDALLIDDGRLRLVDVAGHTRWTRSAAGSLLAAGDLRGDGTHTGLFVAGRMMFLLDLTTGATCWQRTFEPASIGLQGVVDDFLTDLPGSEVALFPTYGEWGAVLNLAPPDGPRVLWERPVVDVGEFNERHDHHGGTVQLDRSQPDRPVVWNLRRHRCRGFDARTGARLGSITYAIGGEQRRNYGPLMLGRDAAGALYGCVFAERVQIHVHALRLHRDRDNELAWQHYYGESYKETPGVALVAHGVADVDGDGDDEMVYSVRDPAADFRSFVRARRVVDGTIAWELADHWGLHAFSGIDGTATGGLLAVEAPGGATPDRGVVHAYAFGTGGPQLVGTLQGAGLWGPAEARGRDGRTRLLVRSRDEEQREVLGEYAVQDGALRCTARTSAPLVLAAPLSAILPGPDAADAHRCIVRDGARVLATDWLGSVQWEVPLEGGDARLSAADLDRDGRAELLVASSDQRLRAYALDDDGSARVVLDAEHVIGARSQPPVAYDLLADGRLATLAAGRDEQGRLVVRAHHVERSTTSSLLWEAPLPVGADDVRGLVLNPGDFLGVNHAGVAVSVTDERLIREGTYMLDGRTGRIVWFKGLYRDGPIVMPCRPSGVPIAYDFDGDGVDEVGMDMLSYMAFLRGHDGAFAYVRHTSNIRTDGAVAAGRLYNTFCPLFSTSAAVRPHWFVTGGFGPFGLLEPDPTQAVWTEDLDYDVPPRIALVDVDGDGRLEAGYAALNDRRFVCRDAWTGAVEWTLELPFPPDAGAVCADFDGDGRGEFFVRRFCLGVDPRGHAEVEWESPVDLQGPLVADFDGDGRGELAGVCQGRPTVLRATPALPAAP